MLKHSSTDQRQGDCYLDFVQRTKNEYKNFDACTRLACFKIEGTSNQSTQGFEFLNTNK